MLKGLIAGKDRGAGEGLLFDLSAVCQICRQIQDVKDEEYLDKERRAVEDTKFSTSEVESFRSVFEAADLDGNAQLTTQELKGIIQKILYMDDRKVRALASLMRELDEDGDGLADFPEFIRLMRRIQDGDFLGIGKAAETRVRKLNVMPSSRSTATSGRT